MSIFRFKHFSVLNERSAMKVNTDGVLLGASMTMGAPSSTEKSFLLDIGTGTGSIALMAAQRMSEFGVPFHVDAIDIDVPSSEEAAQNFAASPWADAMTAHCIALQKFEPECEYDHIFSNPPYFENSLQNPDARDTAARHTDSLSYREICQFASARLKDGGMLSLVLPAQEEKALLRCARSWGLMPSRVLRIRTTERKPFTRMVAEFVKTSSPVPISEDILTLQDGPRRTKEFASLVGEFLLDQ